MSVWIYKDSDSKLIKASELESVLSTGWSVVKGGKKKPAQLGVAKDSEFEELKEKAKSAGVKGWHRMSKETLIEKINECKL